MDSEASEDSSESRVIAMDVLLPFLCDLLMAVVFPFCTLSSSTYTELHTYKFKTSNL